MFGGHRATRRAVAASSLGPTPREKCWGWKERRTECNRHETRKARHLGGVTAFRATRTQWRAEERRIHDDIVGLTRETFSYRPHSSIRFF